MGTISLPKTWTKAYNIIKAYICVSVVIGTILPATSVLISFSKVVVSFGDDDVVASQIEDVYGRNGWLDIIISVDGTKSILSILSTVWLHSEAGHSFHGILIVHTSIREIPDEGVINITKVFETLPPSRGIACTDKVVLSSREGLWEIREEVLHGVQDDFLIYEKGI